MEKKTSGSKDILQSLPLLVFEYEEHVSCDRMLMFSLSKQSIVVDMPDIMAAKDNAYFNTMQGWLLFIGEISFEAWLWHPVTGETISLPPIHDDHFIPVDCKVSGGQWGGGYNYDGFIQRIKYDLLQDNDEFIIGNITALGGKVCFTCP
jgi:hypothetical protein